ncbi:hypothetical protein SSYRP_v1c00410 [Spiroplasma syrphidicola EA-1]|uniref:Transmembrane protein n=1 Tax=Spiroplasma syrphidicola EA-1 TaxID=1276229 RepID=R4U2Q7_9MOLU|nr:APC family permease [Spiroplasma syrphidicola]AGM25637.1 hypothetical protein SSYRP_v1c00410 [Spiroplasma syrphidicola EA-1]
MFTFLVTFGWVLIIIGSLIQIFAAVLNLLAVNAVALPSIMNKINDIFQTSIFKQDKILETITGTTWTYVVSALLLLVAIATIALSSYEIFRIRRGNKLSKPYIKILLVVVIIASLVFGKVSALVLAGFAFIGLLFIEAVLFDLDALKNYADERNMIIIYREDKRVEREIEQEGKQLGSATLGHPKVTAKKKERVLNLDANDYAAAVDKTEQEKKLQQETMTEMFTIKDDVKTVEITSLIDDLNKVNKKEDITQEVGKETEKVSFSPNSYDYDNEQPTVLTPEPGFEPVTAEVESSVELKGDDSFLETITADEPVTNRKHDKVYQEALLIKQLVEKQISEKNESNKVIVKNISYYNKLAQKANKLANKFELSNEVLLPLMEVQEVIGDNSQSTADFLETLNPEQAESQESEVLTAQPVEKNDEESDNFFDKLLEEEVSSPVVSDNQDGDEEHYTAGFENFDLSEPTPVVEKAVESEPELLEDIITFDAKVEKQPVSPPVASENTFVANGILADQDDSAPELLDDIIVSKPVKSSLVTEAPKEEVNNFEESYSLDEFDEKMNDDSIFSESFDEKTDNSFVAPTNGNDETSDDTSYQKLTELINSSIATQQEQSKVLSNLQENLQQLNQKVEVLEAETGQVNAKINEIEINTTAIRATEAQYADGLTSLLEGKNIGINPGRYSLYSKAGYSNTYATQEVSPSAYQTRSKNYLIDDLGNIVINTNGITYEHINLHNIAKYTRKDVAFVENCPLCKK